MAAWPALISGGERCGHGPSGANRCPLVASGQIRGSKWPTRALNAECAHLQPRRGRDFRLQLPVCVCVCLCFVGPKHTGLERVCVPVANFNYTGRDMGESAVSARWSRARGALSRVRHSGRISSGPAAAAFGWQLAGQTNRLAAPKSLDQFNLKVST